ncbi:branched-chain amino acid ABC transporter permease [Sedimentitalea sp. CY04]|uniref:Branched-chain amino acid ABC transporter permease n=1 Tax=Parasedimentitalea denitrificans TaxID=2211118 RepID=A0ABX0W3R8_9RHOB|nr:branched-chain amino acid ABC transporter permease [Sedimentitalea sp. CY04]NIZ60209.1 branched-chain amino acid ABC transporter permease [Sedimentitalea sp. CY04]
MYDALTQSAVWRVKTPKSGLVAIALAAIVLALAPVAIGPGSLRLLVEVFTMIALAQAWNLLAGYTGFVSVGQQAFIGIGAYGMFAVALKMGLNPFSSVLVGGIVAAVIGAFAALALFRLRGPYFAIGTWVLAELFRIFFINTQYFGGASGLTLARVLRGIPRDVRLNTTYWLALALALGSTLLIYLLLRSRFGLAVRTVRDNEASAESAGVNVWGTKFMVFVLASFITGCAGAILYLNTMFVGANAAFSVKWSALIIFVVIIGGIGTIEGPIVGALVYFTLREYLSDFGTWYIITFGLVAIAAMIVAPQGIWGYVAGRFKYHLFPVEAEISKDLPR